MNFGPHLTDSALLNLITLWQISQLQPVRLDQVTLGWLELDADILSAFVWCQHLPHVTTEVRVGACLHEHSEQT